MGPTSLLSLRNWSTLPAVLLRRLTANSASLTAQARFAGARDFTASPTRATSLSASCDLYSFTRRVWSSSRLNIGTRLPRITGPLWVWDEQSAIDALGSLYFSSNRLQTS